MANVSPLVAPDYSPRGEAVGGDERLPRIHRLAYSINLEICKIKWSVGLFHSTINLPTSTFSLHYQCIVNAVKLRELIRGTKRLVSVNICSVEGNSATIFVSKVSPGIFVIKEK